MVTGALHVGLLGYLEEQKSGHVPRHHDGSLSLVFDSQYRVTCLTLAHGELLLESRIVPLPDDAVRRRSLLEMLLEQAGNRLEGHTERIAFAPGGQMLVLQQIVPARADRAQFGAMLDSFLNALAGWRRLAGVL
jgi:Tir chaperone protein (CesT) family